MDFLQERQAVRAKMLLQRRALPASVALERSRRIQAHLLLQDCWQKAQTVLLYVAVRGEVDTGLLLQDAWETGKRVLLPRCSVCEKGRMSFVRCRGTHELITGAYGIPEPAAHCEVLDCTEIQAGLLVIPGLAFDLEGHRLGHGGGYYDRFLAALEATANVAEPAPDPVRVGLAYVFQCLPHIDAEQWDFSMNALCTEEGFQWV